MYFTDHETAELAAELGHFYSLFIFKVRHPLGIKLTRSGVLSSDLYLISREENHTK